MKNKKYYIVFFSLILLILLNGFIEDNPYFIITKKDVELKIPKGFPKPVYDFKQNKITPEGFVLGRKLFYDPILSNDYFTSCASCHQRFAAFAHIDHPLSHGVLGKIGKRNVPALQNLIWKDGFMADGGINHLDLQPIAPMTSPVEMAETLENVIKKLQNDSVYPALFYKAFGDSIVTSEHLLKSLSQFLCLMVSCDSRYDKYMQGKEKFTEKELSGLKLFRNHCAGCHKEPLFTDNSYRNIGLKPDTALKDSGRAAITGLQSDYMKFKVPSLRNVELTYPYMHDGRFKNLQLVMNHYAEGNFFTAHIDEIILRNVGLTEEEKSDIIVFLKTLTDKTFLYDRRFADPNFR
ncbi:MAG: cytochrome c peroxidase [Bacteroidia bacterium]